MTLILTRAVTPEASAELVLALDRLLDQLDPDGREPGTVTDDEAAADHALSLGLAWLAACVEADQVALGWRLPEQTQPEMLFGCGILCVGPVDRARIEYDAEAPDPSRPWKITLPDRPPWHAENTGLARIQARAALDGQEVT